MIWSDFIELYVKWSGYFPFLIINGGLKLTWDRQVYLWSDLYRRFVSFYKSNYNAGNMYAKWLQKHCTKQCSISRLFNSLIFMSDTLHSLLFDYDTIIVI